MNCSTNSGYRHARVACIMSSSPHHLSASQTKCTVPARLTEGASDNGRINSGHTLPLAPHTRRAGGHPESQEMVAEQEDNPADLTLGPDFKLPAVYSPHQEGLGPSPAHMRPQASTPCTCLHMYPHVPTHILTYPHVSTCPHASTCIHISTHIYTYPHASIHVQTQSPHLHVTTCIHTHPHPLTHIHRYPQVSTCIHIHTHQHTSTCIHMQPHTFTSIHTHSYTSTCIHTYPPATHVHPHASTCIHMCPHTYIHIHTHPHMPLLRKSTPVQSLAAGKLIPLALVPRTHTAALHPVL